MSKKYPWEWDEEEIWESIFDPKFSIDTRPGKDLLEYWADRLGIDVQEYKKMEYAVGLLRDNAAWRHRNALIYWADPTLKDLEDLLRRPTMSSQQRKVAKLLRDRLKDRINRKLHGSAGWIVTTANGSVDAENL